MGNINGFLVIMMFYSQSLPCNFYNVTLIVHWSIARHRNKLCFEKKSKKANHYATTVTFFGVPFLSFDTPFSSLLGLLISLWHFSYIFHALLM